MKKSITTILLICLSFLSHCNRSQSKELDEKVLQPTEKVAKLSFFKEKSIGVTEVLYPRIFLDPKNKDVFVYGFHKTEQKSVVLKYNHRLEFVSKIEFLFGEGPGDIGEGTTFMFCGDLIYAPDNTLRRVNIFDKNFKFIKFYHALDSYYSTTFSESGNLFFGIRWNQMEKGITLDFYRMTFPDVKKSMIHRVGPFWSWNAQKKRIVGKDPGTSFFIKNEKVYFLNMADYQIMLFALDGTPLRKVRLNVPQEKVPYEKKKAWIFDQHGNYGVQNSVMAENIQPTSWTVPLKKGFVVIRRHTYTTICHGFVDGDYFDYQLNYLGKTQLPCFYQIFQLSIRMPDSYQYHDGSLYLLTEDDEKEDFFLEQWHVSED